EEKEKRADELIIANKELAFQNEEKEKRADELIIANKELAFQNKEKEKRANELIIANKELAFQNEEKEKRANELIIANKELIFQFEEKKKRANKLIIANRELSDYKYALDQSAIITITDEKGIITHINDNFCKISKYSAEELIGKDHQIINSGYHPKEFIKGLWTSISNGKIWRGEFKNRAKDGSKYWVNTTIVPFLNEKGKQFQYLAILTDITEQKQLQIQEEKLIEDIVRRNKNLEQFSYIISHNLRSPVANILGLIALLQEENIPTETIDYINNSINLSANKLDEVIKDLNDILQVKNNITEIKELVSFKNLTSDIYVSIDTLIKKENATINWDFFEAPEMKTIKSYLHSIFYNLITNSLKFRQRHVPLLIEIKSQFINNKIILLFKDNGMGIDLKKQNTNIFGLYKRFHADYAEGKGVGLYMVKTQVETIGGTINIKSEVNEGTEFRIEFPI
ncbi:MAG: PAS domain-containing sensor histidine kinase, partial [Bacteroidetes bacterium]|nr:PAS domain-containing sensor histidine kinase [Bacteroidota bacterium]